MAGGHKDGYSNQWGKEPWGSLPGGQKAFGSGSYRSSSGAERNAAIKTLTENNYHSGMQRDAARQDAEKTVSNRESRGEALVKEAEKAIAAEDTAKAARRAGIQERIKSERDTANKLADKYHTDVAKARQGRAAKEAASKEAKGGDQPRDERGRFASK